MTNRYSHLSQPSECQNILDIRTLRSSPSVGIFQAYMSAGGKISAEIKAMNCFPLRIRNCRSQKLKKTNHKQTERRTYEKSQFRSRPHLPVCSRYGSPQRIHFAVPCSSRQPHPQVIRRILAEPRFQFGRKRGLREFAQPPALMIMLTEP